MRRFRLENLVIETNDARKINKLLENEKAVELVDSEKEVEENKEAKSEDGAEEENEDIENLTKDELKELLNEQGIKYKASATKEELKALL